MWAVASPPPFILPVSAAPRPARGFIFGRNSITASARPTNSDSNPKSPGNEIGGSDVLWALQRATAAKKRNRARPKKRTMRDGEVTDEEEETSMEVRPICIDSEWGPRLKDLENRLQQLSRLV
ncbi:uncharacterized protein LOC116194299 [Punica granatum]|uniref:Uncharacterized protein LOC116194299 n=1 Tax=Punica granatum TaxID=22663 RepID=A0A218W8G3_PUNGR|nr:uncharacterized protein LOC116194299 [Punica granatum]OWM68610.1 hypothetical protein CDL15_Pgr023575 [Punica granatum]